MKFVISGGWSYGNVGDEVILESTMYLFNKFFPNCEKIYTAFNINNFKENHSTSEKVISSVHKHICRNKLFTHNIINYDYRKVSQKYKKYKLEEFCELLDDDTVFVMSGGGYFTDNWNTMFVARLIELQLAIIKKAKIFIIGQSIGPINSELNREIVKKLFEKCDYISVRDKSSFNLLKSIGIENVQFHPDFAVVISDIFHGEIVGDKIIGIMPSEYSNYQGINFKHSDFCAKDKYDLEYSKLINELSKQNKLKIIMSTEWKNDIFFAKKIVGNNKNVEIVECKNSFDLCKNIYSTSFFISTKMHPLIIATSFSIPIIGISYNFKVDDYLELVGLEDCCVKNYLFNCDDIMERYSLHKTDKIDISSLKGEVYAMMDKIKKILKI